MKSKLYPFFVGLVFVLLSYGTYLGLVKAPTEATMGDAQRIFYYHVPAAITTYTLFFLNFVASIIYLWKRSALADAWAVTFAEVGLVFATVVMLTGPIWAHPVWGIWWTWDARLTSTFVLWLLYVSYLLLRTLIEEPDRRVDQQRVGASDPTRQIGLPELLDHRVRAGGSNRQAAGELLGGRVELLVGGHHSIDHAPVGELLGGVELAAQRYLARPPKAGAGGDAFDTTGQRNDAQPGFG